MNYKYSFDNYEKQNRKKKFNDIVFTILKVYSLYSKFMIKLIISSLKLLNLTFDYLLKI